MARQEECNVTVTSRLVMRSPGRPPIGSDLARAFLGKIAQGLTSEQAGVACGVSSGSRSGSRTRTANLDTGGSAVSLSVSIAIHTSMASECQTPWSSSGWGGQVASCGAFAFGLSQQRQDGQQVGGGRGRGHGHSGSFHCG